MKKLIALILALVCVLGLVGCAAVERQTVTHDANTNQESIVDNKDNVSTEVPKDMSEIPGGTTFVVEIRDRTEEEELFCSDAEELFYGDKTTEYRFGAIKSHYVIVTYNNGNSEDITTALNAGRATIADLDMFGIEYLLKSKK